MTANQQEPPVENVVAGSILALLVIPVGAALMVLISSIGIFASIVGFLFAIGGLYLYRLASGGVISRMGAWIVTAIVAVTIVLGIWLSLVVGFAGGLGKLQLLGDPAFWSEFNQRFGAILNSEVLFVVLALAFGALGAFRTLRRAFMTAHVTRRPDYFPKVQPMTPPASSSPAPTVYQNDVDAPPTGSADDKTLPPAAR